VTSSVELIGGGQTSRTGTDDGDSLASADLGWARDHPALLETAINDGALNRLDTNRILVDTENASTLARSRAHTTCKLREVVGHQQAVESILPLVLELFIELIIISFCQKRIK
jgi:hypothetical protein